MSNTTQRKATIQLAAVMKLGGMAGAILALGTIAGCSARYDADTAAAESLSMATDARDVLLTMRGNEPFWRGQMSLNEFWFDRLGGEQQQYAIAAAPATHGARQIYQLEPVGSNNASALLTVDTRLCFDSMTGMPYPQEVLLSNESGEVFRGCGGEPSSLLVGSEWQITTVRGEPVAPDISATLQFDDTGSVYGSSGCNRYTGSYQLTGENLQFGQMASTRMACAQAHMQLEDKLLTAMTTVTGFTFDETGALRLQLSDGGNIRATR